METINVKNDLVAQGLRAGIIQACGVCVKESPPELLKELNELVRERRSHEFPPPEVKNGVRTLLKKGGFKPSGRNKPASEYLAQAAREDRFPAINNLVDINNLLSLESGLPISLLDGEVCGTDVTLRLGKENERYVFNQSGQEIELAGLICLCGAGAPPGEPLGNPIKDSMRGKIQVSAHKVLGVIYAPSDLVDAAAMASLLARFEDLLTRFGEAAKVETFVS